MDDQIDQSARLGGLFEQHRGRLRAVAYRMLGSLPEAEDAVQDTWGRFSRSDPQGIENLGAWLNTVVARVCLNALRARSVRREDPVGVSFPEPVVCRDDDVNPETQALWADSVGLAMVVVLDTLSPAERLAFVLHDVFAVPFEEIAPIVGRSTAAARQLASRARRRVHEAGARAPDVDLAAQRVAVDAFFGAARRGDLKGLMEVLDPDVVARSYAGTGVRRGAGRAATEALVVLRGAAAVANQARLASQPRAEIDHALVNGAAGVVIGLGGRAVAVLAFTVVGGRIAEIDAITDPTYLAALDLGSLRN